MSYWYQKRFPVMSTEKDSDYETYELTSIRSDEYETPYKRDDTISESEVSFRMS